MVFHSVLVPLLLSALVSLGVLLSVWSERRRPGITPLIWLAGLAIGWSVAYLFELASLELSAKVRWHDLKFVAIAFLPTLWLLFILESTGAQGMRALRRVWPLLVVPLGFLLLLGTNRWHGWFYARVAWIDWLTHAGDHLYFLAPAYGPVFWFLVIYSYLLLALSLSRITAIMRWRQALWRGQALGMLLATLLPAIGNFIYLFALTPLPYYDLTPVGFAFSGLVLALTLRRFRLSDVLPVAHAAVLQSIQDGMIVLDAQGRVLDYNPAAVALLPCPSELRVGQPLAQACPELGAALEQMDQAGQVRREVLWENGSGPRFCELSLSRLSEQAIFPWEDQALPPLGRLLTLRDVTAQRHFDQVLRESEARYRTMFEASADAIFLETISGRILDCNSVACEMHGYTKEELLQMKVSDLVPPDQAAAIAQQFAQLLETGWLQTQAVNRRRDGEVFPVEIRMRQVTVDDEPCVIVYVRDLTAQERAARSLERQTQELLALYQTLLEINAQQDLSLLLPAIVERLVNLLGAPMGALYLTVEDPPGQAQPELELVVSYRLPEGYLGRRLRYGEGLSGRVAQSGEIMVVEDYETWPYKAPQFAEARFHRILAVPLKIQERVLGVINITDDVKCGPFEPEEIQLVNLFAGQAALALYNARLYAAAQAELVERTRMQAVQHALYQISQAALTAADLRELYAQIHAVIRNLMPAEYMYIALYDPQSDLLSFPYYTDPYDQPPEPAPPGRGLTEYVLRSGQPLYAPPEVFEDLLRRGEVEMIGASSLDWIGVPLFNQGRPIGVLAVQTYDEALRLGPADLEVLSFVSTQIAMAIERKRAEAALRASEERYRLLFENAPLGIFSVNPQGEIVEVNQQTLQILGSPSVEATRAINVLSFPPLIAAGFSEDVRLCLTTGQPCSRERFYTSKWGKQSCIHYYLTPIHDAAGQVMMVQGILEDITERVTAEQALQASQRQIELQVRLLTLLHDIDLAISRAGEVEQIAQAVVERLKSLDESGAVVFLNRQDGSAALHLVAQQGLPPAILGIEPFDWSQSCAGEAVRNGSPLYLARLKHEDHGCMLCRRMAEYFDYCAALPLLARQQTGGVLLVLGCSGPASSLVLDLQDPLWQDFLHAVAMQTAIALENAHHLASYQQANRELQLAYDTTIEGWSRALEFRDQETKGHTNRVTEMTVRLAQALGVQGEELVHLRRGVLLHDIGKMGVPDSILLKAGDLSEREWEIMRLHPIYARDLLEPIEFLRPALDIPYCHHEKWDGSGYPQGLKGEQIPLAARIFAVVDVWDALSSTRPYHAAWPEDRVVDYLCSQAGKHFDPQVVKVFLELLQHKCSSD